MIMVRKYNIEVCFNLLNQHISFNALKPKFSVGEIKVEIITKSSDIFLKWFNYNICYNLLERQPLYFTMYIATTQITNIGGEPSFKRMATYATSITFNCL